MAGVTITNSQCPAPSGCDNSGGGSTLWPGVGNFSICNTSIAPWTLAGFRWKSNYNGWSTYGGPGVVSMGANPTTYEQRVATYDTVLRAAFCLNSYSLGGSVPAHVNGQPFDYDLLIKNGSCSPVAPFPTPTPMTCADVVAASNQAAFYDSTLCIQNWLGKNGGIDSGGMINTFYGQTQIQLAKPASGWSVNTDPIIWDPYGGMGNSPLYLMANAAGQEYLNIDMMFIAGIGSKESKAANVMAGTPLFIPNNAAGVAGTYHVEDTTFDAIVAAYPGFFADYACVATYPNVTTAIGTACLPNAQAALYHYMSQAGYTPPYLSNNSAQLVNSVFAVAMNMFRVYDGLLASKDLCFQKLLENGSDPLAAIKIIPAAYNQGINSGFEAGALPPSGGELAASDITSYTAAGNSNYRDDVLRTATNLSAASASCPHGNGVFDAPISQTDLQTFFFGNGGTVGAQGDGGLLRQFAISAQDRTDLWSDVLCAFNALKGRAPTPGVSGTNNISYRYDFLAILRVARQYFRLQRAYPTQSDFTDWVTAHSAGGGAACGLVSDDTYPTYTALSLAQNATVCPGFPVTLSVTDNVGVSGVDWSLDPDWLQWQPASSGGGGNYSFSVPGGTVGFPANGATGTLWIRAYDDCGNQTVRPVTFTHSCGTPTPTVTKTATRTATRTASPTRSATPTASPSPSASASPTTSPTRSATPTVTASPSATASPSTTPSRTPTASPSFTPSPAASPTDSPTRTATFTASPSLSATVSATATPSRSPTASPSGSPSVSASPSLTATRSSTASPSVTVSPSDSPSPPGTLTGTPTATHTRTATLSATPTDSFSVTPSLTDSPTPSVTATLSPSFTGTATRSASPTPTATATPSRSFTASATLTPTLSITLTGTLSPSFTETPSFTVSPTVSPTHDRFFQQETLIQVRGLYPNPFSDRLGIYYTLRVDADVTCTIYNVAGEPIKRITAAGRAGKNLMTWLGENEAGGRCATGVYNLHLDAAGIDHTVDGFWERAAIAR